MAHAQKPRTSQWIMESFIAKFGVRAAGHAVVFFQVVDGEVPKQCSKNLALSPKLPSSTWVWGGLGS